MNKAQVQTWKKLAVSLAALLIMSVNISIRLMTDTPDHPTFQILGILSTLPLILIVILDWGWKRKKIYDERDLYLENRSSNAGFIAAFAILGGASILFSLIGRSFENIKGFLLPSLTYLAFFTCLMVSYVMTLIQYSKVNSSIE